MNTKTNLECLENVLSLIISKNEELVKQAMFYKDTDYLMSSSDCIKIIADEIKKLKGLNDV